MKVFTCTSFTGHYPVGTSAVIVAKDVETACKLLYDQLIKIGPAQPIDKYDLTEVSTETESCSVLQDGNY